MCVCFNITHVKQWHYLKRVQQFTTVFSGHNTTSVSVWEAFKIRIIGTKSWKYKAKIPRHWCGPDPPHSDWWAGWLHPETWSPWRHSFPASPSETGGNMHPISIGGEEFTNAHVWVHTLMDSSRPPCACPFSARPSSSDVNPSMLWERLCSSSWRLSSRAARVRSFKHTHTKQELVWG